LAIAVIGAVLVDEQAVARIGVENVLAPHPDIKLIASVKEMAELDLAGTDVDVDVVILGTEDGNIARALAALPIRCALVMICTAVDSAGVVAEALRHGAVGLVSRTADPAELLFAIAAVTRGASYICPELVAAASSGAEAARSREKPVLAPRELETATLLAQGLTHRQISRRMGLTEATVSTYVKRLRGKLGAGNKAELTRRVIELGYVPLGDRSYSSTGGWRGREG
jgi:DNA-binding NarL/FixJ family response regulator